MKIRYISLLLLVNVLFQFTAQGTPNSFFISQPSQQIKTDASKWHTHYAIQHLCQTDRMSIASGIYYLIQDTPFNENSINANLENFILYTKLQHNDSKNAVLKAFEKSYLASYKLSGKNAKDFMWKESLIQYYNTVFSTLPINSRKIAYGKDQGKTLPDIKALKKYFSKAIVQQQLFHKLYVNNTIFISHNNAQKCIIHISVHFSYI